MSHRIGRVASDLSHIHCRAAKDHGLSRHQSTSNNGRSSSGKAKQKLSLLLSGVVAWTRSESTREETGGTAKKNREQKTKGTSGAGRRGLDNIGLALRKYVSMVEQLLTSYSASASSRGDKREARRRRPHTFTHGRGGASSSKRRLSSAPASLRGSPANSGRHLSLSVGGHPPAAKQASASSSEASTMDELQSAIQAAIAHCKNSAGGEKQQRRKC